MEIAFAPSFKKSFRKRITLVPAFELIFWDEIALFMENPFNPKL